MSKRIVCSIMVHVSYLKNHLVWLNYVLVRGANCELKKGGKQCSLCLMPMNIITMFKYTDEQKKGNRSSRKNRRVDARNFVLHRQPPPPKTSIQRTSGYQKVHGTIIINHPSQRRSLRALPRWRSFPPSQL